MPEAGNAEFKGKADFGSLIRQSRAVVKALKKIKEAREEASGPITFEVDEASLRRARQRIEDAVDGARPDPVEVEVEPDAKGFDKKVNKKTKRSHPDPVEVPVEPDTTGFEEDVDKKTRRTKPDPVEVPVEPDVDPFERGLRKAVADAERKRYEVKIATDVDQSGLDAGLRRLRVQTARGKYQIEVPVELTGEDLVAEVRRQVERAEREQVDVPVDADTSPFEKGIRTALGKKRGPVDVPVDADVSPLERAVRSAIAKAERETITINTDVDQTGVDEGLRRIEVQTKSGRYKIEVPVELSGKNLAAEVSRLVKEAEARSGSIDVPVEPDGSNLRRKVAILARLAGAGNDVKLGVDVDDSSLVRLRGSIGGLVNIGGLLSGVLSVIKWPAFITGAQLAVGAVSALAAAAIGAVSALGPLVGLVGSLPALGAAVGGVFASIKLGFSGVGDALKAYTKSQDGAGKAAAKSASDEEAAAKRRVSALRGLQRAQQAVGDAQKRAADLQVQAVKRVASAERSLQQAQKASQKAQEGLTRARKEAAEQLADLRKEVSRGALDEERAILNVDEARARLNEVMADSTSTDLDKRDAILGLREAERDLADLQAKRAKDQADLNDAEAKGVEGSERVVSAKERVADAEQGILDAQQELADAQAGIVDAQLEGARMVADAQQGLVDALEAVRDAAVSAGADGAAAVDPFAEAMSKLPPSAQQFVRFLISLQPLLDRLKKTAADNMLPGLEVGLRNAVTLFPLADRYLGLFARSVGDAAAEVSTLAFEPGFVSDLDSIGTQGVSAVRTLTSAFKPLLRSLVGMGAAAAPLTEFLSGYVAELLKSVSASLDAGRASGAMTKFFGETAFVFKSVLDAVMNLIRGLIKMGAIAYDVIGRDLISQLDLAGRRFRDFTSSLDGQNKIRQFFEDAKPAINETLGLIGDVVKMFFRLSGSKELAPLIRQIREDFLPVLEKLLSGDNSAFAKSLIDLVTQVGKVFSSLGGPGGPLIIFIDTLAKLAQAVAWLSENVPGFNQFVGAMAILIGISKGVSFAGWITGGSKLIEIFSKKNAGGVSLFTKTLDKLGPVAGKAKTLVVSAFMAMGRGIAAAGAWMLANPIVLAIVAIIAVIALLVWKWDWVKEHVVAAWQWLYDQAWKILPGIADAFGAAVDWIKDKWDGLVDWFGGIVSGIADKFLDVTAPIRDAWNSAWDTVVNSEIGQKVGDIVGKTVEIVKRLWGLTPLGFIINNWSRIWEDVVTVASAVWGAITAVVGAGIGFVVDVVSSMLDVMLPIWQAIWDAVVSVVTTVWGLVVEAISSGINTALTIIDAVLGAILFVWDHGWQMVVGVLSVVWARISSIVSTIVGWLTSAWSNLVGVLQIVWAGAWNTITTVASTVMGALQRIIGGALNTISSIWSSVWNGLAFVLGGAWNTIKSVAAAGVNGVIAILNVLIKGANAVLSKLPGGVKIGEITYRAQFAEGGRAQDGIVPGVGNRDTVPAMLTPDEFVVKQRSARRVGYDTLAYINEHGELPPQRRRRYAKGGKVRPISSAPSYAARYAKGGIVTDTLSIIPDAAGKLVESGIMQVINQLVATAKSSLRSVPGGDSIPGRVFVGVAGRVVDGLASGAGKIAEAAGKAAALLTPGGAASALVGALPFFHAGGGVGFDPNREVLALLQRGEGVMSTQAMTNVRTALGSPDMSRTTTTIVNNNTNVNVEVNNPVGEPTEDSLHRSLQKLAEHGILPTTGTEAA